jgi:squalene-hopene/tetraprenyl-beta-curcumene cyclase
LNRNVPKSRLEGTSSSILRGALWKGLFGRNGNGNGNGNGKSGNGNGKNGNGLHHYADDALFSWENFFLLADRVLKIAERSPVKPLRRLALRKAEAWMVSRFEDSDGLGAIFPSMCNSVMAMNVLGYDQNHPLVVKALRELEELEIEEDGILRLQPCVSPVWDTAQAVNALHESGLARDQEDLAAACRWLVSKEVRKPGDWQVRVPGVEVSGWYFQFRNEFYPDIDDTAAVVMALERVDPSRVDGIHGSLRRGIDWVIDMQCSDGGWAAFDVDVKQELLTKVPYADHNAMLDPACADITGRCLEMIGRFPVLCQLPHVKRSIRRGVEYLKRTQEGDGSWYGRWGVNYIYGTWQAIKGLVEVGEDPSQEYIRRAVDFLKSHQNEDGGWGECCHSYHDPKSRGQGESTASQTAWALMGLIAAGDVDSPHVERGVVYLLRTQKENGDWDENHWTGTGFPRVFYLKYHLYSLYFPLFALGMYRNAKEGLSTIQNREDIELRPRELTRMSTARRPGLRTLLGRKG